MGVIKPGHSRDDLFHDRISKFHMHLFLYVSTRLRETDVHLFGETPWARRSSSPFFAAALCHTLLHQKHICLLLGEFTWKRRQGAPPPASPSPSVRQWAGLRWQEPEAPAIRPSLRMRAHRTWQWIQIGAISKDGGRVRQWVLIIEWVRPPRSAQSA